MYTKYKIKYGNTQVHVVQFKAATQYNSSSEYLSKSKKLADELQCKYKITCSDDDHILVPTVNGLLKLLPNNYYVVMGNGKGFIYNSLDFNSTFQKV